MKKELLLKCIEIATDINMSESDVEIFINYSPHVKSIELRIFVEGWEEEVFPYRLTTYLDWDNAIENLKETKEILERLLVDCK